MEEREGEFAWRWAFVALALLLCCCEAFPFSPHQAALGEGMRGLHAKNLERLQARTLESPIRFAILGDIQIWHTETRDAVARLNRDDLDFVIQVGDITEFGLASEYVWTQEILGDLEVPLFTVVGNHDVLSNGRAIYETMYGPTDYQFDVGGLRFVFLDTNSREVRFDGTVPNLFFLESALSGRERGRAVVVSHVPPWHEDFDPHLEAAFVRLLLEGRVSLSIHGHIHERFDANLTGGGVRFVVASFMKDRTYLRVEVGVTISVEEVSF